MNLFISLFYIIRFKSKNNLAWLSKIFMKYVNMTFVSTFERLRFLLFKFS